MPAQLTLPEIELARTMIANLERAARSWVWYRWVVVSLGVAMLAGAFLFLLPAATHLGGDTLPFGPDDLAGELTAESVKAYVDAADTRDRAAAVLIVQATVLAFFGVGFVVDCVARWNRAKRDHLTAALFQSVLDREAIEVVERPE